MIYSHGLLVPTRCPLCARPTLRDDGHGRTDLVAASEALQEHGQRVHRRALRLVLAATDV